jgi:tetratricopeptide (TPR) repeat protein
MKIKKASFHCQVHIECLWPIIMGQGNGLTSRFPHHNHLFSQYLQMGSNSNKGKTMPKAKNVNEYIAQQQHALTGNPECGTTHYNLGVALLGKQQDKEAEHAFLQAIDCSPSLAEAYVQLGGICLKRGDLDGCLDWNQRAVKARPGFSEGYGNIGFIHMQRGNIEEAIKALKRATVFNFRFVQGLTTLATAYLMKGEIDAAIEACRDALKVEPNFAVAHNNLGIAYLEKGDNDNATRHLRKAVELGYEVAPEILKEIGL